MNRDWKSDLSSLRKKTLQRNSSLVKENSSSHVDDSIRTSINVNDTSLSIIDPTLSIYTNSTPKAKRDFIVSPTLNSSSLCLS